MSSSSPAAAMLGLAGATSRLDQFDQGPPRAPEGPVVQGPFGSGEGVVAATEAVAEQRHARSRPGRSTSRRRRRYASRSRARAAPTTPGSLRHTSSIQPALGVGAAAVMPNAATIVCVLGDEGGGGREGSRSRRGTRHASRALAAGRRGRRTRGSTARSAARRGASSRRPRATWRRRWRTTGPGSRPWWTAARRGRRRAPRRRMSVPAGKPSANSRAHPVTRSSAGRGCCAGGASLIAVAMSSSSAAVSRREGDGERLQVGLVGQHRVERFEPSSRGEQQGRHVDVVELDRRDQRPQPIGPGVLVARRGDRRRPR